MYDIAVATRNPRKLAQIQAELHGLDIRLVSMDELGVEGQAVESALTLGGNARKKADYVHERIDPAMPVIAEDTGVFIRALGYAPGVRTKRWAGEEATPEEIVKHALKEMTGLRDRWAYFQTTALLLTPTSSYEFLGTCDGRIASQELAPADPDMPYSGIFIPAGYDVPLGLIPPVEVSRISHRAKAFRVMRDFLVGKFDRGLLP